MGIYSREREKWNPAKKKAKAGPGQYYAIESKKLILEIDKSNLEANSVAEESVSEELESDNN